MDAQTISEIQIETIARVAAEHWRASDTAMTGQDGPEWHGGHDPELMLREDGRLFFRVGPRCYIVDEREAWQDETVDTQNVVEHSPYRIRVLDSKNLLAEQPLIRLTWPPR